MTKEEAYAWIEKNIEFVKEWIEENLYMHDEAREITQQSTSGFSQSVRTKKIVPFVQFGKKRKTGLYLLKDLIQYKKEREEYLWMKGRLK